jgi:hypothetical protein
VLVFQLFYFVSLRDRAQKAAKKLRAKKIEGRSRVTLSLILRAAAS